MRSSTAIESMFLEWLTVSTIYSTGIGFLHKSFQFGGLPDRTIAETSQQGRTEHHACPVALIKLSLDCYQPDAVTPGSGGGIGGTGINRRT